MAQATSPAVTLTTPRLVLRPPGERDVSLVCAGFRRNAKRLEPWRPASDETLTKVALWIAGESAAWRRDERRTFLIVPRMRGAHELWGHVALSELTPERQSGEIGFWVDQALEGRGVAYEALMAVLHYADHELTLARLAASVLPDNDRCRRLLERTGFRRSGTRSEYLPVPDQFREHLRYTRERALTPAVD